MTETVYILTAQSEDGEIIEQEVFSKRPKFRLGPDVTLRMANVDGGDSVPVKTEADLAAEFDFERQNSI